MPYQLLEVLQSAKRPKTGLKIGNEGIMIPYKIFFFRWRYCPLWVLACRTMPLHFSLSTTNSLHLLTPSTWRSFSTSSLHPFLGLPLRLVAFSSWVKIFLGILSSILYRWPSQPILCPFIHFTIFSPLLTSSSFRFVLFFHSPLSYLRPYSFNSIQPLGRFSRNQNPIRRPVWLWHTASWASS